MPAISVSSQLSEAVYFVSIIGLSILLPRPVDLVFSGSQQRSAQVVASGIEAMIDSMSPGITVVTSLETYPGVQLSVVLSGTIVAASFGNATARQQVRWELTRATLSPGTTYSFTVNGGQVMVAQTRNG